MMTVRERVARYRSIGAGAELVRVEVLVPADARRHILDEAAKLRHSHRSKCGLTQDELELFDEARRRFGAGCLWNCSPPRTVESIRAVAARPKAHGDMTAWHFALRIEKSTTDAA